MSLIRRRTGAVAVGSLLYAALAIANPTAGAETLVVGVEETPYLPHYQYADGTYRGFGADVLAAFAASKNYQLDYRPLPVNRLFAALVGGDIDLKYPDNPLWAQPIKAGKEIAYSDPVIAYIDGVSVLPAHKGEQPEHIKTLGTVLGFTAYDWLDRVKSGAVTLQENPSLEGLLRQTVAGRTDGAYANVAVAAYALDKKLGTPGVLVYDPGLPHTESAYHLSTAKRPKLIEEFNAWMRANAAAIDALKVKNGIASLP